MANIASMVVDLELNFAKWEQNLNAATGMAENAMKRVGGAADLAKNALGALGGALTIGGMVAWVKGIVDATARLKDLEQQTGVSGERLSALARVAKLADTDMGIVAGGLQKLSKRMYDTFSGSEQAGQAFAALGLTVTDTSGKLKDPDKMLLEVAKKLDTFRDGAGKTALMMEIFGKAGANLGKFLADLAEQQSLSATRTQEQIDAADRVDKAFKRMQGAVSKTAASWVLEWLPALEKAIPLFKTAGELAALWFGLFVIGPKVIALAVAGFLGFLGLVQTSVLAFKVSSTAMEAMTMQLYGVSVASTIAGGGMKALGAVAALAFAAYAGWEIGKYLSENFLEAQLAGIAMVAGLMKGWEWLKFGFNAALSGMKNAWSGFLELVGMGLEKVPGFGQSGKILQNLGAHQKGTSLADLAAQRDATLASDQAIFDSMANDAIAKFAKLETKTKADKPEAPALPSAAGGGSENFKRDMESTLRLLDQGIAAEKKRLDEHQAMFDRYYRDDTLSINDYFGSRVDALWQAADATQAYYDREISALKQFQAKFAADSEQYRDAANKMNEIGGKAAESYREYSAKIEQASYDQGKAHEALRRQIEALNADYQALLGNSALAAGMRFDAQHEQLKKRLTVEGRTEDLGKLESLRSRAIEDAATDGYSGASRAARRYLDDVSNVAKAVENLFTNAFKGMEDAFVSFVKTGKMDFRSLADSIISDIIRIQVRQSITGPMVKAMSSGGGENSSGLLSFIGSIFGGGRALGGEVSAGTLYQVAENGPELLTSGGNTYLMMGAQGGNVIPMAAASPAQSGNGGGVTVQIIESPGNGGQVRQSQGAGGQQIIRVLVESVKAAMTQDVRQNGPFAALMQSQYGLSRAAGAVR